MVGGSGCKTFTPIVREGLGFVGLQGSHSLDSKTGVVSLAAGGFTLDREERETPPSYGGGEGRGGGGKHQHGGAPRPPDGHQQNAPVFSAERYEFFLLENSHQFKVPLVVTATDQGNPLAVHC